MKSILITGGGGSGIGKTTARQLATAGHHVFLGGCHTDRLAKLANEISVNYRRLDVTDAVDMRASRGGRAYRTRPRGRPGVQRGCHVTVPSRP
ncbi:SDR family NAD(P)-dependent oxidoreductase [Actinomadura sp. 9N407]|uniref:SDR family NAD(P)-dependent oxidoreductase n=1 Tax=Actinomadura sp. 9N407 TaxID=3375154 RepID=UPI00379C9506